MTLAKLGMNTYQQHVQQTRTVSRTILNRLKTYTSRCVQNWGARLFHHPKKTCWCFLPSRSFGADQLTATCRSGADSGQDDPTECGNLVQSVHQGNHSSTLISFFFGCPTYLGHSFWTTSSENIFEICNLSDSIWFVGSPHLNMPWDFKATRQRTSRIPILSIKLPSSCTNPPLQTGTVQDPPTWIGLSASRFSFFFESDRNRRDPGSHNCSHNMGTIWKYN